MSSILCKRIFLTAVVMAGGGRLFAESPRGFDARFSFRTGTELQANKDNLKANILGGGLGFGYNASFGRIGCELGYQYKSGKQYLLDVNEMTTAPGSNPIYGPESVDSRKSTLSGFNLRLSYERHLSKDFVVQGGIQVGSLKFRQEVVGTVADGIWTDFDNFSATYVDTYNATPTKTSMSVSPYAGVSYIVNPNFTVGVECLWLTYKSIDYVHVAGSMPDHVGENRDYDYLKTHNRHLPLIQFGCSFHF